MANISVTNALTDNAATSDITKVGTNFTDLVNGLTDGTKDISVSAITTAGVITGNSFATIATAATGANIYSVVWTDYSGTSTVVGCSSYTTKKIFYKKIGRLVFVMFEFNGTSNSTDLTFTVPYAAAGSGDIFYFSVNRVRDNGAEEQNGFGSITAGATTVYLYRSLAAGASWTAANGKLCGGQFWYETTT